MATHAPDCQSHIVDVRGRPDECSCGAWGAETSNLPQRLRDQASNVEGDGWINAARHMREAADIIEAKTSDDAEAAWAEVGRLNEAWLKQQMTNRSLWAALKAIAEGTIPRGAAMIAERDWHDLSYAQQQFARSAIAPSLEA